MRLALYPLLTDAHTGYGWLVGRKFSFKCHRKSVDGVEHIYPVNDFAFHPMSVPPHMLSVAFACVDPDRQSEPLPEHFLARALHSPARQGRMHANRYNTFASGGCDGAVYMWDWENKRRLSVLGQFATRFARCT